MKQEITSKTKLTEVEDFMTLYKFHRNGQKPSEAAAAALIDWVEDRYRHQPDPCGVGAAIAGTNDRWVDKPEAYGLRFVGWHHELNNSRTFGYATRDDGGMFYAGVVYRLPGGRGFVPGCAEYDGHAKRGPRSAPTAALLSMETVPHDDRYCNIRSGGECGCAKDAAVDAERSAERAAEKEYEYNHAYDEFCIANEHLSGAAHRAAAELARLKTDRDSGTPRDEWGTSRFEDAWGEYRAAWRDYNAARDNAAYYGITPRDL